MAKKIVSADTLTAKKKTSTKSTNKSNIDLGKLADLVSDNKETIGKLADTLLTDSKIKSKKKSSKKSSSTDLITRIVEILKSLFGSK